MYCSIEEAWSENNFGSYNKVRSQPTIELYENTQSNKSLFNENRPEMQLSSNNNYQLNPNANTNVNQNPNANTNVNQNHIHNQKLELNCSDFYDHINECSECRKKFMKYYCNRNYSLTKLIDENPQLNDTLLVFFIGLLILFLLRIFKIES